MRFYIERKCGLRRFVKQQRKICYFTIRFSFWSEMKFSRHTFWANYREPFGRVNRKTVIAVEDLLNGFETLTEWRNIQWIAYAFGK